MERSGMGAFTLHRSDVHTQCEADSQEAKVRQMTRHSRKGQMIRRGRVQFKELGAPVDNADITKMTTSKLGKVQRMVQNMGTMNHDTARKKGDSEKTAEYTTVDAKDAELLDDQKEEQDEHTDSAQQPNKSAPCGLFGNDLPHCTSRDKASDGLRMLHELVRESEVRVQHVKAKVPGTVYGLDYRVSMLDFLMPDRSNYPPAADKRAISARGPSRFEDCKDDEAALARAPASARAVLQSTETGCSPDARRDMVVRPPSAPRPSAPSRPAITSQGDAREAERRAKYCPGRPSKLQAHNRQFYLSPSQSEMRPRPLPIRLPSLASWIAKSEPAMGGRSERGENSHIREKINELLGMDKDKVLKLDAPTTQDQSGIRRGRTDMKRKIEKQLDVSWNDKSMLKKMLTGATGGAADEGKIEPERTTGPSDAPGAAGVEEVSVNHDGRRKREWTESEEAEAYAKFVALLREPDPTISPVARLRSTLHLYQESRDKNKNNLQNALYSMDADRLNSLKRRAKCLNLNSHADARSSCALMRLEAEKDMLTQHTTEGMKKQYLWYRGLWHLVRGDKRDLPKVAHFIFDFVKQVLEFGEEFNKELYFAMLEQVDNYEFTTVIASLIVNMASGIEDLTVADIVEWFRSNRYEVPSAVAELTGKEKEHAAKAGSELGDTSEQARNSENPLTFVTEMP